MACEFSDYVEAGIFYDAYWLGFLILSLSLKILLNCIVFFLDNLYRELFVSLKRISSRGLCHLRVVGSNHWLVLQVVSHGVCKELVEEMKRVADELFKLPVEEKLKLYSDDPLKTIRLSTSFNVKKEAVHNWRDYLRLHCWPLEQYAPKWPSGLPSFKEVYLRFPLSP